MVTAVSPPISPKKLKIYMNTEQMPPVVLFPNSAALALFAPGATTPALGVQSHIALWQRTNTKSLNGKGELGYVLLSGVLSKVLDMPIKKKTSLMERPSVGSHRVP